jgi:hypothetical protein
MPAQALFQSSLEIGWTSYSRDPGYHTNAFVLQGIVSTGFKSELEACLGFSGWHDSSLNPIEIKLLSWFVGCNVSR